MADFLFAGPEARSQFVSQGFTRSVLDCGAASQLIDVHARHDARVCYVRVSAAGERRSIALSSKARVTRCTTGTDFGTVLSLTHEEAEYTLWLPGVQEQFRFDGRGRIEVAATCDVSCEWAALGGIELKILAGAGPGQTAVVPYIMLKDPEGVVGRELGSLGDLERRLYRRSNWFQASRPKDIWKYLIGGSLYDPRSSRGVHKRFKCQQCALAWWNYFRFLGKETGKGVYGLLQDEVAHSILLDLSAAGEWGHGFWSDEMETHARFHLDGLRLLISQYERTNDPMWLQAAERGMGFASHHLVDRFSDGSVWFLHDTLERKRTHRFRSTVFGKSPGNSLCLNTHVQALTVLHRLRQLAPNNAGYEDSFTKGVAALRTVLDHQPGEMFYRMLGRLLRRYWRQASPATAGRKRIENALRRRAILALCGWLKRVFPRLVFPDGFIDRDLTLSIASDHYHNTNLKDLLILYRQEPAPWLREYIRNGFRFSFDVVRGWGLDQAVRRSPYYFEFMDILHLYDRLIEPVPPQEVARMEETLQRGTGAYSLEYYASELVRG